jgi:hypothetical protein
LQSTTSRNLVSCYGGQQHRTTTLASPTFSHIKGSQLKSLLVRSSISTIHFRGKATGGAAPGTELKDVSGVTDVKESLDDWKTIYRFNHIVAARSIQRFKVYQTGFTCFIILPWSLTATYLGQSDAFYSYCALSGSALACE